MASSIKRHGAGQQQQEQQQLHGAILTNCQFACLALTLSLGTISQWYNYTVYTQLSTTLAGVFFPASDWITAHLSFYGVYAAGFLARPLGAVCFGHVADAYSRRASVVTTMWVTLLATVGIGCLPTYQHVGVAAPVMLLVLRFVQGMSVGGEYGAAVVYLFEAAPLGRKGLCASLAQQAVAADGGGAAAPGQKAELKLWLDESAAITDIGCEVQYVAQLELAGSKITTHVPLAVLARQHKQVLWLQFFLEASYAATFYIFTSWLPSYLRATTNLPTQIIMWALLAGMALFIFTTWLPSYLRATTKIHPQSIMWALLAGMALFAAAAPYGGILVDRGLPKVWALMGLSLGVVATSIPVMFALHAGSFVYLMVLLPAMLGVAGVMGGVLSSIGPQMYPAAVRVTGFTLGHSLAMSAWGGLSPFIVSAILLLVQPSALAAGLLLVVTGLVSWAAAVPLISLMPHINARGVRPAPQQLLVNPHKYLARLKERRRWKRRDAAGGTAAAAAAATATATAAAAAAVAAAGHGVGRGEAFEGR
ncbi:hypothetical protein OEZ85_005023 [Tetradesmus obliquus]|uniref:Major facilitator superfamily (MFS) profile domain-containing protein n=1 Tax=Tetradesmus obliquus TaxID=3088 RepID=A0ABY8UHY0_TETOB|nr:hypothetical protein OEZ85_005023 [Tetradesmus obliquus]